jgi:hypothetical protein
MLACLQNMIQVNEEAKTAMDVAKDGYFAAVNELYKAELNKKEAWEDLQYNTRTSFIE